ncbi:bifunctional DNA-binding transcriptional regulator/O6-methylguanine-DNA methyltransferase Ada [Dictyobacter formicarum]|uniref:Bifunctional transcriptional activator/DNA repair enzyme protein Ada n=1 Tax=Dictyobacter formicarum TaxID=2778368 RepID=A0ABQ3VIJ2_9CHLR|nr:bifunctional DNA-binding transcriptional regulator/O6-methylguanine-DNA methyltransferase Ada [Dictyobacter formicarum]GHO85605.1 bifunctional transcriptional activator/DNA repair enzyme protein Ada [Dictyobacter formicarum]
MNTTQEEQRWLAVMGRDNHADGASVYGVRSTGIYCKPSCPSRKPLRENVMFFSDTQAAEEAGYRPCLRCQPQRQSGTSTTNEEIIQRMCTYIEEHLEERLTLAQLSQEAHLSPFYLQRIFKQATGITPRQYVESQRLKQLKNRLREGEAVTAALYDVGYGSISRLYERVPTHMGMTPNTYRRGGQGMQIAYTIVDSPLGRLLVGATEKGVCAVSLGDQDTELERELRKEYPAAEIQQDNSQLETWVRELLQFLQGEHSWSQLNLPIDIQATAFQWRVWNVLRNIPQGETRSYGEVARSLGDKKKARAVANACATNPVALIIPCHRVVREDGAAGGYRWGIERKRRLLAQEKADS